MHTDMHEDMTTTDNASDNKIAIKRNYTKAKDKVC